MHRLLDECISPRVAEPLRAEGHHVVPLRDVDGLGDPDYKVLRRRIDGDFVLVTQDARDFRKLIGKEDVHPGLIILPNLDRHQTQALLRQAIDYLVGCGNPVDLMVNRVLEVSENGALRIEDLPPTEPLASAEL